jgi:hypothetical protein
MIATLAWILLGVSLVPAHRAARGSRTLLVALLMSEAIALGMVVLASTSPDTWVAFAQEDGTVEWATFFAFVLAAGWLVVVVRKRDRSWWFQGATFLLALFCLAVAGEEISWGQRLFGFKPPDVFLERNFQQELNLHNVLMDEGGLGFKLESKHLVIAIVLGFAVAWPLIVRRKRFQIFAPLAPPFALLPLALGIVAAELAYAVELTGEGAELVTGLLFLAAAIVAGRPDPAEPVKSHPYRPSQFDVVVAGWLVVPLVIGALTQTVMARVVFGSDEEGTRTAEAELELLVGDVVAGATEKLSRRTIHKRVYTSIRDGYLRMSGRAFLEGGGTAAEPGAANRRNDRRGYFLDPWNNPYWIHFDRRTRVGHVYSFGPNRRRDVAVRRGDSDPGDDLIVPFTLPERDQAQ